MKTLCVLFLLLAPHAAFAANAAPPAAAPAPPPAAPPKRSAADLEKLVAPIALYPDPLIATILPASVYPLEIVQAARFVANTNNLAKLDEQPWDDNVKAVARFPQVIKMMNDDLSWTMELGEAFLAQDKDVMDAMQSLRAKAQNLGTLKTTPQQTVVVTNIIVEKTVAEKVVVVTNTVVQIQPASPQVIYVPTYNPAVVYYPPPPTYVGPPPGLTFAAGMAMGAVIANNCDWHYGGCYHGDVDVDINNNINVNRNANVNNARSTSANTTGAKPSSSGTQQKWQPDQARLSKSGTPSAATSTGSKQARGYGSSSQASKAPSAANRASPSSGSAGTRPSTGTGSAGTRPSTGTASASRPSPSSGAGSPQRMASASPSASSTQRSPSASPSAGATQRSPSASPSRASSGGSAFSGASSGSTARADSSRGFASRSSGSFAGRSGGARAGGGVGR